LLLVVLARVDEDVTRAVVELEKCTEDAVPFPELPVAEAPLPVTVVPLAVAPEAGNEGVAGRMAWLEDSLTAVAVTLPLETICPVLVFAVTVTTTFVVPAVEASIVAPFVVVVPGDAPVTSMRIGRHCVAQSRS
jgi:hypothetical protein